MGEHIDGLSSKLNAYIFRILRLGNEGRHYQRGWFYPLAITNVPIIKSIGGTSAGAVAAVITAEAEYGRRKGDQAAYRQLVALPKDLGTDNLLLMFQPSTAAVRVFRVVLAAMKAKSIVGRTARGIGALVYQFWGWTLLEFSWAGPSPSFSFSFFQARPLSTSCLEHFGSWSSVRPPCSLRQAPTR
jgi:hypothetical protein